MIAALVPAAGSQRTDGPAQAALEVRGPDADRPGRDVRSARAEPGAWSWSRRRPMRAEGPAVAAEARRAGAEVVVPQTRPAEMRDSIELGLEMLARHDDPPERRS